MSLPRLAMFVVRLCVPADRVNEALGDLEEVHRVRLETRRRWIARLLTTAEAFEFAGTSLIVRFRDAYTIPVSWIDFKIGLRMLVKYPGLTLVGGLAMAFGIFAGTACYEFYTQVLHPRLPFDDGERVVMVELLDDRTRDVEPRTLHDFAVWRTELSTLDDLGAAQPLIPNLDVGDGNGEPIRAAAITASAFDMARVPPLMGRTLLTDDESPAAPPVVVVAHDAWRVRFGADPGVLGRKVKVGDVEHTVVGVMPEGFGFPRSEQLWMPLRVDPALGPLSGPGVYVFGRLAPGATLDQARSEIDSHVAGGRIDHPDVYAHLDGQVLPYAEAVRWGITGDRVERIMVMSTNLFAGLFLMLVCGNVGLLMFARAAAREGEIIVRTALGASRRRIVGQLFAEALALATVAAIVGVGAAGYGLERFVNAVAGGAAPAFWYHASLSTRTLVYATALTLVAAGVVGVLPALKLTAEGVGTRLRGTTSGGGGLRFGGVWTAVIVLQVAATVSFPVVGWAVRQDAVRIRGYEARFADEEFLSAGLRLNTGSSVSPSDAGQPTLPASRFEETARALEARLEAEPTVAAVTLTGAVPGAHHPWRRIEMDEGGEGARNELDEKGPGRQIRGGLVAPDFFDVLGIEAIRGRTFHAGDADQEARTIVVDEAFVDEVLGGRNPIGRHLRYLESTDGWDAVTLDGDPGPWYRIVGVVPDLVTTSGPPSGAPRAHFYHAVPGGSPWAPRLLVRVHGDPVGFASRLRQIAAEVEPDLALLSLEPLHVARERELRFYRYWIRVIYAVSGLAVLLSLAGIYSVMSFTVARRTREIGVRVALGAGRARVAGAIFRRPLLQVGAGLLAGFLVAATLSGAIEGNDLSWRGLPMMLGYGALMTAVCLSACVVPMRRALGVEPTEALSSEG